MIKEFYKDFLENIAWWSLGWFALLAGLLNLTQGFWGWLSAVCLLVASSILLPISRAWLSAKIPSLEISKTSYKANVVAICVLFLGILLTPVAIDNETTLASGLIDEEVSETTKDTNLHNQPPQTGPLLIKLIRGR